MDDTQHLKLKFGAVHRILLGDDNWECMPDLSWTLLSVPLPFADFSLDPVTVIERIPGFDGFSEFCEFFQQIIETGGSLREN